MQKHLLWWIRVFTILEPQSQVMAEYSTPVYPHGTGPPAITDQITDQNTPYCDELRYAVSNDIRMLTVIQRRDQEWNSGRGYQEAQPYFSKISCKY